MKNKTKYVTRKSDGKKLKLLEIRGDEVCIVEKFSFWTPNGSRMKPLTLWHKTKDYII